MQGPGSRFRPFRSLFPQRVGANADEAKLYKMESHIFKQADHLQLYETARDSGARLVDIRCFNFWLLLLHRPTDLETVYIHHHEVLRKSRSYQGLRVVLGEGLVTSEGKLWKRQRKLVQSIFHHKSILGFAPTMLQCAFELANRWTKEGIQTRNMHDEMVGLTFDIVGETLFSTRLRGENTKLGRLLEILLPFSEEYGIALVRPPLWLPTPKMRKVRRALSELDAFVGRIVEQRRKEPPKQDLLGRLMEATDETGGMSEQLLRDEIITLASAGHETTASALTFCLHLLADHPEVQDQLHQEAVSVGVENHALAGENLKSLELTERVIRESMRLYPPVWAFERVNTQTIDMGGHEIPAGTQISASPYALHRDPGIYPDPLRFDPNRFLPDAVRERPRHTYIPFGMGPRSCIGASFAIAEAKLALAEMMRTVRVRPPAQRAPLTLIPHITLRPKGGLPLIVEPR